MSHTKSNKVAAKAESERWTPTPGFSWKKVQERWYLGGLLYLVLLVTESKASSILLHSNSAVVWHPAQTISGELTGLKAESVLLHHNDTTYQVLVKQDQTFSFPVLLQEKLNRFWVEIPQNSVPLFSDTLTYTLGYRPVPVVKPFATVHGNEVILGARVLENPYGTSLTYGWVSDPRNPASTLIQNSQDSVASVMIPKKPGAYYFNLLVLAGTDSVWVQTLVHREGKQVRAFDPDRDYPTWMNEAVVYQATPRAFVQNGTFADLEAKLPELKELGINTLYLQPITKSSYPGQGYDVVDYLGVHPDLGTEEQLHRLIVEAKAQGMRVLFDVVLNHSSIKHPYAQDRIRHGKSSHYYDYYQHQNDGKPYSSHYNSDEYGFINYFWKDLVNLNYQNEEVQRWMLEVCKYWVREFDIDGYRLDAIWGVNARMPSFAHRLRTELKSLKPEVLLLAEDKGVDPKVFSLGYDAAYDWTADTSWVSQWSWEYQYSPRESHTIFNHPQVDERGERMRKALFENGDNPHRQLRFIENNDLPRFVQANGLEKTKMAAAFLFSLPGIPMLFNGQEIGFRKHPYSTKAIFTRDHSIQELDTVGLFPYYRRLIRLHRQHPVFRDTSFTNLPVMSGRETTVAFHRQLGKDNLIAIINLGGARTEARVDVGPTGSKKAHARKYRMKDILTDETLKGKKDKTTIHIPMEGHSVRWLHFRN